MSTTRPPETIPDRFRLKPLIIFIVVVLMWSPGLSDNILLLDSAWLVRDNAELASGKLSVVWDAFFSFDPAHRWRVFGAEYLPIRDISVWLDFLLWSDNWQMHRLVNILLYAAGCALLMQWLRQMGVATYRAALASLAFAMIPAHLANVLWLAGRKDVLGLCAVLLMMRYGMRASGKAIAGTAALLLVAIWSKNTSYSGLAWLFAAGAIFAPEKWRGKWVPRALLFGGLTFCCIGISTIVGKGSGIIANSHVDHLWQLPVFQGQLLLRYLWVLLDPSSLSLVHTTPSVYELGWTELILAIVGWATLIVGPFVLLRRNKLAGFGLLCWGVGFVPVSQLIPLQNTLADRYLLLPTVGLAIMLAALPRSRVWDMVILVLIGYWSFYTWHRMPLWSSEILLLEDALEKVPNDEKSQHILTHSRIKASPENGQGIAEAALKTYGSVAGLHHLLATQHADPVEALRQHQLAVSQAPQSTAFRNDYAIALQRSGQLQGALEQAQRLTQIDPDYRKGWTTLSSIAIDLKAIEIGVDAAKRAIALDPFSATSWCNLGTLSYQQGQLQGAVSGWTKCQELDPSIELAKKGLLHLRSLGYTPVTTPNTDQ